KEHLEKLALVHTLDWQAHGFDQIFEVPATPEDAGKALIHSTRALIEELTDEPSPTMVETACTLLETAPRDAPALTLCKGTNGHGEEVWHDGRIVALSDWE